MVLKNKEKDELIEGILNVVERENIKYIHMQFMDILGIPKSVTVTRGLFDTVLEEGIQFDGSSIMGYATIEESDMLAHPDPTTFKILPWASENGKAARIICDIYNSDGTRFEGDPRYVLQRIMDISAKKGWIPHIGPEIEFFLFINNDQNPPKPILHDYSGYFDFGPYDLAEAVKKDIVEYIELMGYKVEALHHEVAPSQHEIDLRYMDALSMADAISTLKMGIKKIAKDHGLYATFMPKPIYGINGSGMHVHQSLLTKDGENIFYDPNAKWELSDRLIYYVGGLLKYAKESCAIMNAWVNSYKRLVPGYEAPVYITWANLNRSVLVRIPAGRKKATRCELRNPDPAGNPYLQFATMIGIGLEGIDKRIEPPEPLENIDVYHLTKEDLKRMEIDILPEDLHSALEAMEGSKIMRKILCPTVFENFLHIKTKEWEDYRSRVTQWEIENQLPIL